jgi:hypothetical protein
MIKEKQIKGQEKPKAKKPVRPNIVFGKKNYILFGVGIFTIALGYFLLAKGSVTLAPILLVIGYVILVPLSIIIK